VNKLAITDIKSLPEYEKTRNAFRQRVIDLKKHRRLSLGDYITLVFENRDTLIFQIQEMMRVEHIYDEGKIKDEIETYNALIPEKGELSATLFIEITQSEKVREILNRFQGIDSGDALFLEIGHDRLAGRFEAGHSKEEKMSAVHYVRFRLNHEQEQDLRNFSIPATLILDHPDYRAQTVVPAAVRKSLIQDLEGD
jgi:hypothetical protein